MALISVSQYAAKTGKDASNIRRMLATGRLPGNKIGNQWVIDESAAYPEDRRMKSGEFRNWRKRVEFNSNRDLKKTVCMLSEELRAIYGSFITAIILYGSYARGEQTEDSDVDIALLISPGSNKKMYDEMIDCVAAKELECGKVLSVIDIDLSKYNRWKSILPYYKNIDKEGIILWKKAA